MLLTMEVQGHIDMGGEPCENHVTHYGSTRTHRYGWRTMWLTMEVQGHI